MTCPTILLQPVIRTTEAWEYGPVTVHYDEPVTRYAVVMVGDAMLNVPVIDDDGDETGMREMRSMRQHMAAPIARAGGLTGELRDALYRAVLGYPGTPLSLDDALTVHRAATRWAQDEYAVWAQRLAGGHDPWALAA